MILLVAAILVGASGAQAQEADCSTYKSEVTLGGLSGERIDSVLVQTSKPNLGRVGQAIARLHVKTQQGVIRRELLSVRATLSTRCRSLNRFGGSDRCRFWSTPR